MKGKRGSITIEAALCLPIFLMFIYSLLFFIKIVYIQEQMQYSIQSAANQMASTAYMLDKTGLLDLEQKTYKDALANVNQFEDGLTESVEDIDSIMNSIGGLVCYTAEPKEDVFSDTEEGEQGLLNDIKAMAGRVETLVNSAYNTITHVTQFIEYVMEDAQVILTSYGASYGLETINHYIGVQMLKSMMKDHLPDDLTTWGIIGGLEGVDFTGSEFMLNNEEVQVCIRYQIEMPFFRDLLPKLTITQGCLVRAFTGNENFECRYELSEEEDEEQGKVVYITANGKRYHTNRQCFTIYIQAKAVCFSQVSNRDPCDSCVRDEIIDNPFQVVYATDEGRSYHLVANCSKITRTIIEVSLEEALNEGKTLCQFCEKEH